MFRVVVGRAVPVSGPTAKKNVHVVSNKNSKEKANKTPPLFGDLMEKESLDFEPKPRKRTRTVRRRRVRRAERSRDTFVQQVVSLSKKIDPGDIEGFLGHLRKAGVHLGAAQEVVDDFDWATALQMLPRAMEFFEKRKTLNGAEKEKHVIALIMHFARTVRQEHVLDEHGVHSLRIIIGMMVEMSHGRFQLNEATAARTLHLLKHGSLWAVKHCSCGVCCRAKSRRESNSKQT